MTLKITVDDLGCQACDDSPQPQLQANQNTRSDRPSTLAQKRHKSINTQRRATRNVSSETQANRLCVEEEKKIVDAEKKEPNQSKFAREISKKWRVEVKRITGKGIFNKKGAMEAAIKYTVPPKRMKLMQAHDPKLDERVLMCLKQVRGQNMHVSGDLIKKSAMTLAELMQISDFMASNGWLEKFKKHHGIALKTVHGEAGVVDHNPFLGGNNRYKMVQINTGEWVTEKKRGTISTTTNIAGSLGVVSEGPRPLCQATPG
ncbi:Tigger transposable element-derived protein 6 [Thelohanellus kitauei]|uniref:Tigger transposable element-derived protein 6 n=1 Tax=Thelohanellus kitauei TaxID=669202 RepID=A0A0C2JLD2_THEKT|nr:Tigger transposable element-derived protein 6 [Thelohanellus kitauei]